MNKILKLLILNDFFFWTALGFVGPILAIYINDDITGGTLGLTGVAMSIYWITKSAVSLIASYFTDHDSDNSSKLVTVFLGTLITFLVPVGYIFAQNIWHIILIQALFGVGAGLSYPGWMTLFTDFIDKGREGFEWSLDSAGISFGNGVAIAISGFIAQAYGFQMLFILVLGLNFLSLLMIILLLKNKDEVMGKHYLKYFLRKF